MDRNTDIFSTTYFVTGRSVATEIEEDPISCSNTSKLTHSYNYVQRDIGDGGLTVIEDAPGSYARVRSDA